MILFRHVAGTLLLFVFLYGVASPHSKEISAAESYSLPLSAWSVDYFDHFTRIDIGRTPKPWLNVIGNGLFGGHLMYVLSNRNDGRELRLDTQKNAITHTNFYLDIASATIHKTIHGIGYSTVLFGENPERMLRVTYFIESDKTDSEIWLIDNPGGGEVTLRNGEISSALRGDRIALNLMNHRVEQISFADAEKSLISTKTTWLKYLAAAIDRMRLRGSLHPLLLREFIWDIYQVVALVSTDRFTASNGEDIYLRNANMGATYTFLGNDVHGRDTLQMIPAISKFDPQLAREIVLNMARCMDKSGRICHRRLLSGPPMDRGHSDESYWFVIAVIEYLRNTHDLSLTEERAPYLDNELISEYILFKDPNWVKKFDTKMIDSARFTTDDTFILEHLRRSLSNIQFGPHGLPLMEDGDWNDALNWMPKGESTMNAGLYAYCLIQLQDLWREIGETKVNMMLGSGHYKSDLAYFAEQYARIKKAVNNHAWDGQWYIRGFDAVGKPFGSQRNLEGKIFVNPQSWLILAGIPDEKRVESIVSSVKRDLIKDNKLSLVSPAYTKRDSNIGAITLLPPGSNENGGQWRQCTLWWIRAMKKIGRKKDIVPLFEELLLANADISQMGTEPHLYNEYIRGPEAKEPGSAGQQAHVQQAALVFDELTEFYSEVNIKRKFLTSYDYPNVRAEDRLYTITGQGELVPWTPKWIENPPAYEVHLLQHSDR